MNPIRRIAPAITAALFLVALAVGATGWATSTDALTEGGTLGTLAAVPLMYWVMITRTHQITDNQLATAEQRGYLAALDHVGRGLIDVPPPPSPGQCVRCGSDESPGDVISLADHRRPANNPEEKRTAQ
ncbi:hypothetical protein [Streptomyces sp. WAC01280]|uniref:hypothetical protein n=1 Tax=Streptomyces sp. WAC01280 TaxID=2487424 RepID=UPI000F7A58DC|nr:hypothetical protein [Streptomyces sp. WAC01280]RSS59543.1 hypothetical protein EF909_06605 [Streptomyces sp. WAC01280]